jgi:hypothetical protein
MVINADKNVSNIELITTAVKTVNTVVITTISKHNLISTLSSLLIIYMYWFIPPKPQAVSDLG